jgi:hypothetical protein
MYKNNIVCFAGMKINAELEKYLVINDQSHCKHNWSTLSSFIKETNSRFVNLLHLMVALPFEIILLPGSKSDLANQ